VCLEMFSKSRCVRDRSEIFRKLVLCVWAGVGKSPFSECYMTKMCAAN